MVLPCMYGLKKLSIMTILDGFAAKENAIVNAISIGEKCLETEESSFLGC